MSQQEEAGMKSLPHQVFEQFLDELKSGGIPEETIERLRKTLIENGQTSVDSVKAALFSTDNTDL